MFDLITSTDDRPLRERSPASKMVALVGHIVVVAVAAAVSLHHAARDRPPVAPSIMAFVSPTPAVPAPPPAPPQAPPPTAPRRARRPAVSSQRSPAAAEETTRAARPAAAPVEAPAEIGPESSVAGTPSTTGMLGGIEGGVPGGVPGGLMGGVLTYEPPPPPPPAARGPVRVGGQITTPALIRRVEPVYPEVASLAHLTGLVVLEATVNEEGRVVAVRVVRSRHPLLDRAASEALAEWRYSPLVLNGTPMPFVVTVTFTFSVKDR